MISKADLRHEMREQLRDHDIAAREVASQKIRARLSEFVAQRGEEWRRVAVFLAQAREPNLDDFVRALQARGVLALAPHSREGEPFYPIAPDWSNVRVNARGWREPLEYSNGSASNAHETEVIFLPGLAFDVAGNRLGQGGGWYDRILENLPPRVLRVGICFDFQIADFIPRETHDKSVSVIVTDQRLFYV